MNEKPSALQLDGRDNRGRPRQDFADKLAVITDDEFKSACNLYIWLSAYASNNPRSDYHWMADACHDEAKRREKPFIYQSEWQKLYDEARGA